MSKITLENMEFHAYHGCLEHEQEYGNTYLVTLSIDVDTTVAEQTDHLNDTLNYKMVYNVVKTEMEKPTNLIENVARRIITTVFLTFPQVKKSFIKVSKLQPPVGGKVQSVSIELEETR